MSSSNNAENRKLIGILSPEVASYFIAGGCAGAASRTVVSPLERLKIIQQVQPKGSTQYKGVWNSLWFARGSRELDTPKRLASGALAGITSVCSTYPLDLVRARLSIATASIPINALPSATESLGAALASTTTSAAASATKATTSSPKLINAIHTSAAAQASALSHSYKPSELTIWGMTMKIVREEGGVRGLYRGLVATAFGVAPYVGINFAAYELLRGIITPPGKTSVARKLTCGALAGSISQTLTYPFDVLRRKMQVTGMKSSGLGIKYNGAFEALIGIIRTEGGTPRCAQALQRREMDSENALSAPSVPRHRIQDLAIPRPRSSSLAQAMGQSYSSKQSPPSPQKGIAGLASGGFKLKRAFAARRKKSEDATKLFASGSQQLGPSDGPGPSSQVAAAAPLKVTAPSLPPMKRNKLTIVTQVLTGGSKSQSPASPLPPPPPPKPVSLQDAKQSPSTLSKTFHTVSDDHRGSIIPVTPAISSAVTFMRMGEEQREQELPKPEARPKEKDLEKKEERSSRDQAGEATDKELKQLWRKSDSTMSHHTIRPGAAAGNRNSRPVSMAESLQSNHTVVPVNKRLSALLTDAEFHMPEEDDSSFKSASEELVSVPPQTLLNSPENPSPSPTPSTKKMKNRRSMSLNLGPLIPKAHVTPPAASVGSLAELHSPTRSLPESHPSPPITPTSSRETPTLTRAAANGIISPSSTGPQSTGNNIRGRLAAWSATTHSTRGQNLNPAAPTPSKPERHFPNAPPSSFPRKTPSPQPHATGLRQTAISITGGLAPAAGLAKRAVEKMGRAWGGFSSNSSGSGYSSSSSSITSDHNLGRTVSNNTGSIPSLSSKGKSRRTPDAPSGSWSISSASTSDSEAFAGPTLGKKIRGPMRTRAGGIVFGRDLSVVVRETAIGVGIPGHYGQKDIEKKTGHEKGDNVSKEMLKTLETRMLPALIVRCAQHLLLWGVHEEGLFRVNGRPSHVSKIRHEFDTGADYDMRDCSPGELDPHAVASIFKAFLRELPEPILTHSLVPYFEAALSQENALNAEQQAAASPLKIGGRGPTLPSGPKSGFSSLRKPPSLSTLAMPNFSGMKPPSRSLLRALKSLLDQLPPENKDLIRTVTELIKTTAKEHKDTKMPLSNLLLVFCPSLNMNPPLLRVLCEAEEIWEGAPIDSPVLDIKRDSVVLDIKPPSPIPEAKISTEDAADEEGDDKFSDARDGTEEDEALDATKEIAACESRSDESHVSSSAGERPTRKLTGPRSRPVGPRRAHAPITIAGHEVSVAEPVLTALPVSPSASTESVSTFESQSVASENRSFASHGNVSSPPPLSSSFESLPTASSSSVAPSLTDVRLETELDVKPASLSSVDIAGDAEHDILSPSRYMAVNPVGPVEFPKTSGSSPTTPVTATNRRSIPILALSGFSSSSDPNSSPSSSVPPSPSGRSRRLKKPSLHLLFSKRSTEPLNISSPQPSPYTKRSASDSSVSTPLTAMTAPQFDLPHALDTNIETLHLNLGTGFDVESSNLAQAESQSHTPHTSEDKAKEDEPVIRPPSGETPIAKMYAASTSSLSLSQSTNGQSQPLSSIPAPALPSHLRLKPTRQPSKASVNSTASSNHLGLLDDEDQEDWTQSVLIAAGAEWNLRR
ncbi:rho gtpase activator [Moniliophthora roreri]|nr:rho gtpase activator [Moniliophthora roreri]